MSETMVQLSEDPEIAEQKLWRAVIAKTVGEWILGPHRRQREAERFLFHDEDDFYTVCFSAGMDPRYLRRRRGSPSARLAKLIFRPQVRNAQKQRNPFATRWRASL